jgi:MFS transporter, BCD family, chlorophyll transporter
VNASNSFGWIGIVRLGLVQAALGAIVVMTTSTLNRVMVVELGLPALLPGLLVGLHYAVQATRPRMGWGSDVGGRRTPWIVGGMAVLAAGGTLSALAVAWMHTQREAGLALAALGFLMIGLGVSACGTSLLVLLAKRVPQERRAAAATTVWVMMIAGFAVTAGVAGGLLDPYSPARLVRVTAGVSLLALGLTLIAVWRLEGGRMPGPADVLEAADAPARPAFRDALREVWSETTARRFTVFVFVSMLAYSAQDLILEPFAGAVHGYTPGESTRLAGVQHGGVLLGMLMVAAAGTLARRPGFAWLGSLRGWTLGGCIASALALVGLTLAGVVGAAGGAWPLRENVFLLGVANGAFSIGAIGSMMQLASQGRASREGVRMGLWGAAQGIAFGLGGLAGTFASDLARWLIAQPGVAYACVFAFEGALFALSALLAQRIVITPAPCAAHGAPAQAPATESSASGSLALASSNR